MPQTGDKHRDFFYTGLKNGLITVQRVRSQFRMASDADACLSNAILHIINSRTSHAGLAALAADRATQWHATQDARLAVILDVGG